jgi:hypothetical protein
MWLLVLALLAMSTSVAFGQSLYPGVVTVDSVQAKPSESVSVRVWLRDNNIDISAMTLPLKYSSPALTLDSVSIANSVWGEGFAGYFVVDNSARTTRITILPDDMVYPLPEVSFVDGVVAELFFSIEAGVSPHHASIDSVYSDSTLGGDVHVYTRIDISDNTGTGVFLPEFVPGDIEVLVPTGVEDDAGDLALPTEFDLSQNFPNPFNPTTIISYSLPRAGFVRLDIFNILGQQAATLDEGYRPAGIYRIDFDGANYPSGIYFYRLQHDGGALTRKMMLVK